MKNCKWLLSEYDVVNIEMYEKVSGKEILYIIIVIDNYDVVKEVKFYESFEMLIM